MGSELGPPARPVPRLTGETRVRLLADSPEGLQLAAIKAHLKAHEGIKLVWFDAWCLPQGNQRTDAEIADFKRMLTGVNLLYLGTSVLILLDLSYISRFWVRARSRANARRGTERESRFDPTVSCAVRPP